MACQLQADFLKLLLVVRPHKLVEACREEMLEPVGPTNCSHCAIGSRDCGPPPIFQGTGTTVHPVAHPGVSAGQGTLEQAVPLGVLSKEAAEASHQGCKVVRALVALQGLGEGVEVGLAQCLLHSCHEQLGPARLRSSCWPLLLHTRPGTHQTAPTLPCAQGSELLWGLLPDRVAAGKDAPIPGYAEDSQQGTLTWWLQ